MEYVMISISKRCCGQPERASGELAEAKRPQNDLAHWIRSDFVAIEPEKFTRDTRFRP
jgi:hypothetical protein